jgi:hypothetical protein
MGKLDNWWVSINEVEEVPGHGDKEASYSRAGNASLQKSSAMMRDRSVSHKAKHLEE